MAHIVGDPRARGHVAAEGSQGFGEGAHVDVDLIFKPEITRSAAAALADHAEPVGVVHHHAGAVFFREGADLGKLRNVAAHGKDAVGHDQAAGGLRDLLQAFFQVSHVAVAVAEHGAVGEFAAVVEAGVVLTVHDHIVPAADDRGYDAEVGLEAGREGDHAVLAEEFRKLCFQFKVQLQRAVQEARAAAAGAELSVGFHAGFNDLGVRGEAEVVVGAEHDAAFAFHLHDSVLPGLEGVKIRIDILLADVVDEAVFLCLFKDINHGTLLSADRCKCDGYNGDSLAR